MRDTRAPWPSGARYETRGGGSASLLDVRDLSVGYHTGEGRVHAVDGVSFSIAPGEVVAIVGESGSGKSAAALALLGLGGSGPGTTVAGSATFDGTELLGATPQRLRRIRGAQIAMVFQDPMSSLNPLRRIGEQIAEQVRAHERVSRREALQRAERSLARAGMPRPAERLLAYPHELSGGMRQRAMIAMALSCEPRLLIADEPTTALDVTVQAQILAELSRLRAEHNLAVLLISHDLGVVAGIADRVLVMYAGEIVEQGPVDDVFGDPRHPYTWGLLGSIARIDAPRSRRLPAIAGAPPSPLRPPAGCRFQERCPHAQESCGERPALSADIEGGDPAHLDRCVLGLGSKRKLRLVEGRIGL